MRHQSIKIGVLGVSLVALLATGACSDDTAPSDQSGEGGTGGFIDPGADSSAGEAGNGGTSAGGSSGAGGNQAGGANSGGANTGGSAGTGGAGPDPMDEACQQYAQVMCAKYQTCAPLIVVQHASCEPWVKDMCLASAATAPSWTSAQQTACTAAWKSGTCDMVFLGAPNACDKGPGPKGNGAGCLFDTDCGQGLSCQWQPGSLTACGVCKHVASVGEACGAGVAECAKGLNCYDTCYEPQKEGEPCYSDNYCGPGLVCGQTADPCHPPRELGESCGPVANDCNTYHLVSCNSGTDKCEKILVAQSLGAPCGYDSSTGNITTCGGGRKCSGQSISTGTCIDRKKEGENCQVDSKTGADPCSNDLVCNGTCRKYSSAACN